MRPPARPDSWKRRTHYATLGLDRGCTSSQIRAAYRALARQHHPDLHPSSAQATARFQALNHAHETLRDPSRRAAYDRELRHAQSSRTRTGRAERNIQHDVTLRMEELFRGTSLEVRVKDPTSSETETYPLKIPADTAPGTRFRIPRSAGGVVQVRVRVSPNFRFKARSSDLRSDLRISAQRATNGGSESITSVTGRQLRVSIPAGIGRGEILRIAGEGLPKTRGGRGDLLLRVTYRPDVRITRTRGR